MSRSLWQAYPSVRRLRGLLNEGGHSVDTRQEPGGQTLLHRAASDNRTDVIKLLHEHGCQLDTLDRRGRSALNLSLEKKSYEALSLLLQLGADPDNATLATQSTLHQAAAIHDFKFIQKLYSHGAKCYAGDKLNDLPIHRATLEEYFDTVGVILHNSPDDVNATGNRGLTPLHIAAKNSNVEIFMVLVEHGADLTAKDSRGKTPLDVAMESLENPIIDNFGNMIVNRVIKYDEAKSFETVFTTPASLEFLETLTKIDNEYRCTFIINDNVECYQNRLDEATNETLLKYIESDERTDINEFLQIVVKAVKNGLVDEIISKGLVPKISESIFRHVLASENEDLLLEIMKLGVLWGKIVACLEGDIVKLYERTLVKKRVGIKGLVWRTCVIEQKKEETEAKRDTEQESDEEGESDMEKPSDAEKPSDTEKPSDKEEPSERISYDKLHQLLSRITKLWQLRHTESLSGPKIDSGLSSTVEAMKDPLQTLAVWSILTGRFKLTPHLLRQEPYDILPLSLLAAKLLRALSLLRDIEDIYQNRAIKVATTCEGIAIQALRRIKEFDTSQNNILTMEFLRLPLRSYGEYDVVDLAARGESTNFVTIDVVQDALDMFWYSDLFFVRNRIWKMEGTIILAFLPPFIFLLPLIMDKFRRESPTFKNLEALQDSRFMQLKSAIQGHHQMEGRHDTHQEMTAVGDPLLQRTPEVNVSSKKGSYFSRLLTELNTFYDIPCVKFRFHVAAHIMFVMLMSFIVMRVFDHDISAWEWICYLCLLGFLVQEVIEIIKTRKDESLASYFANGWNLIDIAAILCGLLSFFLRLDYQPGNESESIRYASLVLLSTTCLIYWIRLLFVSVILESLGPKLKMMSLMIKKDFLPFLYILFILMIGFGVIFQALLHPPFRFSSLPNYNFSAANETVLKIAVRMFKSTFFVIVGEYGLDDKEKFCPPPGEDADPDSLKDCVNETGSLLVTNIFMVIYIVIMQILLLNVIVAMFSETIETINRESTAMWQFEKYDLIQEFFKRSKLPPPLNLILVVRRLFALLIRRIRKGTSRSRKKTAPPENEQKQVEIYLYYLYCQAISCREQRLTFNGVVIDEEDLDEGNKIIHRQIKDMKKELKCLRNLEKMMQRINKQQAALARAATSASARAAPATPHPTTAAVGAAGPMHSIATVDVRAPIADKNDKEL